MPQVQVDNLTINYDVQGEGPPLLLIPYLAADHACYAFQLPEYTKHFTCIAVDLPGSGESDMPAGPYSTTAYADQLAASSGRSGWSPPTSPASRSEPLSRHTWRRGTRTGFGPCRCTARGGPPTRSFAHASRTGVRSRGRFRPWPTR